MIYRERHNQRKTVMIGLLRETLDSMLDARNTEWDIEEAIAKAEDGLEAAELMNDKAEFHKRVQYLEGYANAIVDMLDKLYDIKIEFDATLGSMTREKDIHIYEYQKVEI